MVGSRQYFDDVAGQWDEMRQGFFSEALRDKALAVAGVRPGEQAADIGAGTGFLTEALVRKGLRVIAVDQSEEMLKAMQRKFEGVKDIEYRRGEAEHLPIPDDSQDYAFANMYLHHVERPLEAIMEMARILRPGGMVVLTDLDEHGHEFLKEEHHDRWMGFKRQEVEQWFRQAGLNEVSVDCANESCRSQSAAGEGASVSIFVASGRK